MSKPHYPTRTDVRLTSPFGMRKHPTSGQQTFHFGIDLAPRVAGTTGVPIYAVRDGVVTERFFNNARGNTLRIKHDNENISTGYQHLAPIAQNGMMVKVGDRVRAGQQIGVMGTTGNSTGIHLHFEVVRGNTFTQVRNDYTDPQVYLNTSGAQATTLKVDGKWGPATERRWQQIDKMAVVDGKISHQWKDNSNQYIYCAQFDRTKKGSNHARHIQRKIGAKQDGLIGEQSITLMQRKANMAIVDGKISEVSNLVKYIQRELNAGRSPF